MQYREKRALQILVFIPNSYVPLLEDRFPLGEHDYIAAKIPVGRDHHQVIIHREESGLTESQNQMLDSLEARGGIQDKQVTVNIRRTQSNTSPSLRL